jgi:hypothetical protein
MATDVIKTDLADQNVCKHHKFKTEDVHGFISVHLLGCARNEVLICTFITTRNIPSF